MQRNHQGPLQTLVLGSFVLSAGLLALLMSLLVSPGGCLRQWQFVGLDLLIMITNGVDSH
jgi:hypothetical protein